jgi:hypothetical protein
MRILSGDNDLGILTLSFHIPLHESWKRVALVEPITDSLARVLSLRDVDRHVAALAARVGGLEADLADSKISERVSGCTTDARNGRAPIDVITAHVANVLSAFHLLEGLSNRVRDLEQELNKRDLLNEAKALLQRTSGLSESEAYMQLRNASRRTRRPLLEVAQAVIAGQFRELRQEKSA